MKQILHRINTNKMLLLIPFFLVLLVVVISLTTCSRGEEPHLPVDVTTPPPTIPQPEESEEPIIEEPEEPEPEPEPEEPEPEPGPVNPLTGLEVETDISQNRPLAIVINNLRAANPQLGISKADIIYEVLVEGGITRMLAIFQDVSDVGIIGSIRSARTYYVDIAQSYDAVFIFAGGSPQAYSALFSRDITRLDGVAGRWTNIFYRDQHRRTSMGYAHSMVTSGELITEWLPTYDLRLELPEEYERAISFAEDGTPADGEPAADVSVRFSSGKSTVFEFEEDDGLYYVSQFGAPYTDGNDEAQVAVTNILVLKTSVSFIPNDDAGRLDVRTIGSGTGYYISGGKYVEIEWSREDLDSQFEYTLADGTLFPLGQGKTYICMIPNNNEVDFS